MTKNSFVAEVTFNGLNLFFPIFPFDPPENIKKPKFFQCFWGDQTGTLGKKKLISRRSISNILLDLNSRVTRNFAKSNLEYHTCLFNSFIHIVEKWPNSLLKSCSVHTVKFV